MKPSLLKKLMLLVALPLSGMNSSFAANVDLLVLYDGYSANYFNQQVETAMQNWVAQTNNVYKDSGIDIQLRLVGAVPHEQPGASMDAVLTSLRVDTAAVNLRNQYGADFVTQLHQTGECGIGYMAVSAPWAWNVVGPDCGPLVLAHELGHNMGLNHSRKQGDTGGARYSYALGHGVDGLFGTVMTYSWLYVNKASGRVAKFSNPDVSCLGVPCGVAVGQPDEAHAAQALNNVKNEIAAFRSATVSSSSQSSLVVASSSRSSQATINNSSIRSVAATTSSRSSVASSLIRTSAASSRLAVSSRAASSRAASSQAASSVGVVSGLAQCDYRLVNQGSRSFTAMIDITNSSNQAINGWSVNWRYSNGAYLTYASGANVYGRNPYAAANQTANARIAPGQRVSITLYGIKPRSSNHEVPDVTGSICR
ncbi:MAG TPA: cellulose binding domain-containing protein [Cellvibrio sp.]|nr:cellulose binding domain-containing protein [Cellvibrio sp.]